MSRFPAPSLFRAPRGLVAALFGLACIAAIAARAADDDVSQHEDEAIHAAVARVAPSVVRIETFGGLERVGKTLVSSGPTTGLAVSPDGYIISSSFNFIQKPATILVHLESGERVPAKLVATDHSRKIVLLKVALPSGVQLTPAVAAPAAETKVGEWSIAVGRTYDNKKPNVSVGIVSAVGRIWGKAIQTDAKISPANYGGPLVDIEGRVLGVLAPMSPMATDEQAGAEWYDSGIGFAVPLEDIQKVLPRLEKGEDLLPGLLGITMKGKDIYAEDAELAAIQPNSPAYAAGLKTKDKIVEADGQKVTKQNQLKHVLGRLYAGDKVKIVAQRGAERLEREIELVGILKPYEHPFFGALPMRPPTMAPSAEKLEKDKSEKSDKPEKPDADKDKEAGVTLRFVYPDSPAAKAGAKAGDRIVAWDGKPIAKLSDLMDQLANCSPKQKVDVELRRGGDTQKLSATLGSLPEAAPAEVPPAHGEAPAVEGAKPATGIVPVTVPESQSKCFALVPESYNPRLSYGVILWLHPPGGYKDEELTSRFKDLCAKHDLIILAPKSADPAKWQRTENDVIRKALDELAKNYHVDQARTVTLGQEGAGAMALLLAIQNHELIHGAAAIASPMPQGVQVPATDPVNRLAFLLGQTQKDPLKAQIDQMITGLRSLKYPVTVVDLGPAPRALNADELNQVARWADSLDRF